MLFQKSERKLVCLLDIAFAFDWSENQFLTMVTQNNVSFLFLIVLVDSRERSERRTVFLLSPTN